MTTFTIYEYSNVTPAGQPIEPAQKRTAAQALGASVQLDAATQFVGVVANGAMNLRIDTATGQAATVNDYALETGKNYGFAVRLGAKPYLYGL